ncbi:MAG: SDR family oxidoreductase [Mariniblastus sp.]
MKTVVITGISRGLGREMAKLFAGNDCIVIGCGRSREQVQSLQVELGEPHRISCVDIADDESVQHWANDYTSQFSAPDFLINNAALINANKPLWEISASDFDQLTAVNINGTANTIRHFVPAMIQRGVGTIVNFSSGWGRSVSPNVAPYCATKWAIEGLTQSLAMELPDGMVAVPLNPGVINTDMLQTCFGSDADHYPSPHQWAARAVPFILGLSQADNGISLTVPG